MLYLNIVLCIKRILLSFVGVELEPNHADGLGEVYENMRKKLGDQWNSKFSMEAQT